MASDDRVKRFQSVYKSIWRDEAPEGYLESAAGSMNLVEFEAHERAKPAFNLSPLAKEEEQNHVVELAERMSPRGA